MLDPRIRNVAKILDAVVHFLPTTKGLVFAISLEVNDSVRIAVAGNNEEHFREVSGQTPSDVIQSIWTTMQSIAASEKPERGSHIQDIIVYLLDRHQLKLGDRFAKGKEQCKKFFELAKDSDSWSRLSANQQQFMAAAENIFEYTSRFFDLPPEKRSSKYYVFWARLQAARTSYESYKLKGLTPSMGWVRSLESDVPATFNPCSAVV